MSGRSVLWRGVPEEVSQALFAQQSSLRINLVIVIFFSDWDEHKLVCGYKLERSIEGIDMVEQITLPKTLARRARVSMIKREAFVLTEC